MKKWIDDVDKKIDTTNKRIDNIVAEEVDAKNLSEVLDKDAPVTITTDLVNNKVTLGVNIDENTMEIDNGKLKAKSTGGSGKYLHNVTLTIYSTIISDLASGHSLQCGFQLINDKNTTVTAQDIIDYLQENGGVYSYKNYTLGGSEALTNGIIDVYAIGRGTRTDYQTMFEIYANKITKNDSNVVSIGLTSYKLRLSDGTSKWNIFGDDITTL